MTSKADQIPDPVLEQATDWMFRLQAAPGDPALEARVLAWVAEDETHARAWSLAQKTWRMSGHAKPAFAREWPSTPPPRRPDISIAPRRRTRRIAQVVIGIAACIALVAALPMIRLHLEADHVTSTGEARVVTLDDGSVAHLAAASAISTAYSADRRRVRLLRGQAYFQVVADRARTFAVEAEDLVVTVTGTAFDVGFTDRTFSVAVASGAVRVTRTEASGTGIFELVPGQGLTIDRATGAVTEAVVPVQSVAAWRAGRLIVENVALADAAAAIGRYYRGAIVIADARLKESRVTGVYDLNDPVRALRVLSASHGGVVREITPYLALVSADGTAPEKR